MDAPSYQANGKTQTAVGVFNVDGAPEVSGVGQPSDPAWNGSDPDASLISIMKAMYATQMQIATDTNETVQDTGVMVALLQKIATNTETT